MARTDEQAWHQYPHHRRWFDKLDLSIRLGHHCGPTGTTPDVSGDYVVRPIYNLEGMGIGARKVRINHGEYGLVEPGYFWCEWFTGAQHSVTYGWEHGVWVPRSSWCGVLSPGSLTMFMRWERSKWALKLPGFFDELADCLAINVEFVGNHVIEAHLRPSPDPEWGDVLIPVWEGQDVPDGMTAAPDDGGGFLDRKRLGFLIK